MKTLRLVARKWWFWVGLVLAVPVVWYLWGWAMWRIDQQGVYDENRAAYLGWMEMKTEQAALEEQYKKDTYGGSTPEETLELFIEALEKKDFELAAKYFVVEKQKETLVDLRSLGENKNHETYIEILKGKQEGTLYQNKEQYEIEFYDPRGQQVHIEFFQINPFTKKWKISE